MINKKALITGITGQDGSYLAEFLLHKGYEVHGIIRRSSSFNTERIDHIYDSPNLKLHYGDLSDSNIINYIVNSISPDEIYNLAAQSHVRVSFDIPEYTSNITGLGTIRLLEAIRSSKKDIKLYQASSSELFGSAPAPQSETTPFEPRSPYAIAKLMSYWNIVNYREGYNIFASNGILFNHESPRRLKTFVTSKIVDTMRDIYLGKANRLELGNLYAKRDWGFAPEYIELMWKILQTDNPNDYAIGTGQTHTVKDFLNVIIKLLGIEGHWGGEGINEVFIIDKDIETLTSGNVLIKVNPKYFRPTEVNVLQADCQRARDELDWSPKVKFKELIEIMLVYSFINKIGESPIELSYKTQNILKKYNWTTIS